MKPAFALLLLVFLINTSVKSQHYSFRYNPYSGMNQDQLTLALEQARKMERNGKVWTGVGTGMLVGGSIMTFKGINHAYDDASFNYSSFGTGLVIMCVASIPLGYGIFAWITGHERANMIEIELLAFKPGKLNLRPTQSGYGLVLNF